MSNGPNVVISGNSVSGISVGRPKIGFYDETSSNSNFLSEKMKVCFQRYTKISGILEKFHSILKRSIRQSRAKTV